MSDVNQFGLSRYIPKPIAREVRQRCGFGCVRCGQAIYEYEHLDPPFKEARAHDPNAIVLLCISCHGQVTRGWLSKDTIKHAAQNPKCKETGFSFGVFDVGHDFPEIAIGNWIGRSTDSLIEVDGQKIFGVLPPECAGGPFRINAYLSDQDEKPVLRIDENEWQTPTSNWDVEITKTRINIRRKAGDISLILRANPPHSLVVERMRMVHKGTAISCGEDGNLLIHTAEGGILEPGPLLFQSCSTGIKISSDKVQLGDTYGKVEMSSTLHISGVWRSVAIQNVVAHISNGPLYSIGSSRKIDR